MQEYVSDYIGLPLLTRGGERLGYVKNVQTDKNLTRVRNLECCDEEEEEFLLPLSAAADPGKGAIPVRSPAARGCKNCLPAPIGKEVFSSEGALLGRVRDFGREGPFIRTLVLSDGTELPAERILGVTDTVLVDLTENFVPRPVTRAKRKAAPHEKSGQNADKAVKPNEGTEPSAGAEFSPSPSEQSGAAAAVPAREDAAALQKNALSQRSEEEFAAVRAAFSPAEEARDPQIPDANSADTASNEVAADAGSAGAAAEIAADAGSAGAAAEIAADAGSATATHGANSATAEESAADAGRSARRTKRAGRGLLTGKILPKDLLDARGNILARAGTKVNTEVIRIALRHDKLFELTLLCCAASPLGLWR